MSTCPECQTPLPEDAPLGLCPACMLLGGRKNSEAQTLSYSEEEEAEAESDLSTLAQKDPSLELSESEGSRIGPYNCSKKSEKVDSALSSWRRSVNSSSAASPSRSTGEIARYHNGHRQECPTMLTGLSIQVMSTKH